MASPTTGSVSRQYWRPRGLRSSDTLLPLLCCATVSPTSQPPAATSRIVKRRRAGRNRSMARTPPSQRLMMASSRYACLNSESGRDRSSINSVSSARFDFKSCDHRANLKIGVRLRLASIVTRLKSNTRVSKDERGILGTESDAIRECVSNLGFSWNERHVIQIALGVGNFQV